MSLLLNAAFKLSTSRIQHVELKCNYAYVQQIVSHHEDLLSQATGVETLEGTCNSIYIEN